MDNCELTQTTEKNFAEWLDDILDDDQIDSADAAGIVHEVQSTRELLLYRTADYVPAEEHEDAMPEFFLCTRTSPEIGIGLYDDAEEMMEWSKSVGIRLLPQLYDHIAYYKGRKVS